MATADDFVQALEAAPRYARQVTCHKVVEEEPARFAETRRPLPAAIRGVLDASGVRGLYTHQAKALDLVRAGRGVVVTTPTASGKTLVYNLPFLERHLEDPDATALYLFPLKALAQDQKAALERLTLHWPADARPTVALYDGDTSDYRRARIRKSPPNVLITNPDMLHLGILPHHEKWTTFLASLSFLVLDEAHTYRGIFGSHMACVLQRLARVCRRYNAHPVPILCTATLGNPGELGQLLLGTQEPPAVVSESGAPRGRRHVLFMDPEESPSTLAIHLLQAAMARGLRTIVYCRSRRMTELVSLWATEKAGQFRGRISAYRAGFLPEERREIEARMASGELLAVVTTSALELGIDIGSLDVCILVGYPGSIMSTLQRGGRVGRKGQSSAVVLVGGEDALDQFFIRNPEEFFRRPPENAVLNPDNGVILGRHVECAACEMPLRKDEPWMRRPAVAGCVEALGREGTLLLAADGSEWLGRRKRPQRDVNLRGTGVTFQIVDPEGTVIGSVDAHQAFRETHTGAVYLHHGRSYTISRLDVGACLAYAVPEAVKWHTNVRSRKSTEILDIYMKGRAFNMPVFFGRLRVTEQLTGYERRLNGSRRLLDIQPLELPPQVFETEGLWYAIPDAMRRETEDRAYHFMGSIHALEHVSIGLMPLLVMADRNDLGGISIPMHPQVGGPAVFVYDGLPGGAGLTASAFPLLGNLLWNVRRTLETCPCSNGCPSCVQSPKCGSGNRPLDKQGALFLVSLITGEDRNAPCVLPAPSRDAIMAVQARRRREAEEARQAENAAQAEGEGGASPAGASPGGPAPAGGAVPPADGVPATPPPAAAARPAPSTPSPAGKAASRAPGKGRLSLAVDVPDLAARPAAGPDRYARPRIGDGPVMVFDVETRRSAKEVGGWGRARDMGVSVVVCWDGERYRSFLQEELGDLFALLRTAGLVVGFNSFRFDYEVLQPFADYDLRSLNGLDLMVDIKKFLGFPVALDNLARATLGTPKSADGLQALAWWKEGRVEEIRAYCQKDVEVTKGLYEFGRDRGYVLFTNKAGSAARVPVCW